jgi:glycosyltransferase involved in cell wall biosynthesis
VSLRVALNLRRHRAGRDELADAWVRNAVPALERRLAEEGGAVIVLAPPAELQAIGALAPGCELRAVDPAAPALGQSALAGAEVLICPLGALDPPDPAIPAAALVPSLAHVTDPGSLTPAVAERELRECRLTIAAAARLIAFTDGAASELAKHYGVPRERIAVVPAAGRPHMAGPGDEPAFATLGLPADYVLADAAGEHGVLLRALGQMPEAERPELVLTGASLEDSERLRRKADGLGIGGLVRLAGSIPVAAEPLVLRRARALVDCAPRRQFPLAAVEALASGTPVVTAPGTPAAELAGDGALVAADATPEALAQALRQAAGAERSAPAGALSWERTADGLLDVARSLQEPDASVRSEPPPVSVVTPTLQMSRFLRDTIESVLGQDYPRLEYLVMDGGSTDGTVDLLRGYGDRLRFVSEPDGGQADAVNRGFRATSGELFAFLNADDTYLPGAVGEAVRGFLEHPEAAVVYGNGVHVDEQGEEIAPYPTQDFDPDALMRRCFICQPAAFVSRSALERVGLLDAGLQVSLDYDLWIRLAKLYPFARVDGTLATSRMHAGNKTLAQRRLAYSESIEIVKRHFGYVPLDWLHGYSQFVVDGVDQFFARSRPSPRSRALALAIGVRHNPRRLGRLAREAATEVGLRDHDGRWDDGWISRRFVDEVDVPGDCSQVRVVARNEAWMRRQLEVSVHLDGVMVASRRPSGGGRFELIGDCPPDLRGRRAQLEIVANRTWHPRARGDRRRVSCVIDEVRLY